MKMRNILNRPVPNTIFRRSSQSVVVISMALFALVFMVVFRPFDIYSDLMMFDIRGLELTDSEKFHIAALVLTLGGTLMVTLSRVVMSRYNRRRRIAFGGYITWSLVEFVLMTLVVTVVSVLVFHANPVHVFPAIIVKVFGVLSIPYSYSIICIMLVDRIQQFNKFRKQIEHDEVLQQRAYVLFHDDKGLRLSVKRDDLVMIESADNYVCVWYLTANGVKREMVRNTLKRIAEELGDNSIRRCHRSYMVNMDRVKVLRREKEGIFIEFGIDGIADIPISKTYAESITAWLTK